METSAKRKAGPSNGSQGGQPKRSKGGSGNKWQTPNQREKLDSLKESMLQVGDAGIWVTCQRGKERQARGEMARICEDYGKKLYNINPPEEAAADDDEENGGNAADDIEASIQRELEGMKPANRPKDPPFEMVRSGLDCLFFVRTRAPVEPIEFSRQVCLDAGRPVPPKDNEEGAKRSAIGFSRFVNRFTPVTVLGRASEKGLDEVARKVLAEHFELAAEGAGDEAGGVSEGAGVSTDDAPSYAIRPTFRAHNQMKRDDVIKKVASLIPPRHKVNLTTPDKVILVDIYQTFCGVSVVGGDWEALKRYNIHELKMSAAGAKKRAKEDEAMVKAKEDGSKDVQSQDPAPA
ncbi:thump domain-containing protein [Microdochium trichocladiopsis]|uniref:Thump domain-containing protein n=1 Tax=Microdochium trichocladiopsis TaxID=1682393 RepID=A0A9P8Y458_9PEZI|nr:thump domain-containing protein [Microdochium trichocladiopsis]KAH7029388.1 thump domain-containing protein [Microdochium trichocladiopsis]